MKDKLQLLRSRILFKFRGKIDTGRDARIQISTFLQESEANCSNIVIKDKNNHNGLKRESKIMNINLALIQV
jgi:hypothetical protein